MEKLENFKGQRNTAGLDKNPDNINRHGRPKKIITILKEHGYSKDDIKTVFQSLVWNTLNELEEVKNNEQYPVIIRIIANQLICAYNKADWNKIKELMEHSIGKPVQAIETDKPEGVKIIMELVDGSKTD